MKTARKLLASFVCAALIVAAAPLAGYRAAAQVVSVRIEAAPSAVAAPSWTGTAAAPLSGFSGPLTAAPALLSAPAAAASAPLPAFAAPAAGPAAALAAIPAASAGVRAEAAKADAASPAALAALPAASAPAPSDGAETAALRASRTFDGTADRDAPEIVKHDGHRFELNMDVRLAPGRENVYRVGTYIFVPHALGITPASLSKESFYQHIQRRIRFKAPRMSLAEILDERNEASPLNRLAALPLAARPGAARSETYARAYTEIRMLGVVAAAALRDRAAELADGLPERRGEIAGFVADARRLAVLVREARSSMDVADAPPKIRETATLLDEYVSLSIVEHSVPLLAALRAEAAPAAAAAPEDRALAELIKDEDAYRASAGFPSVVDKATDSEALFYRRAVLKNLFSSVLALDAKTGDWSATFQVLFGISAALAMFVFLVAMQVVQHRFQAGSVAVILAGVAGYVVKDRIKEILRGWTIKRWRRVFSDAVTAIRDPATGRAVGKIRESFDFVPRDKIPAEVLRIRNADALAAIGEDGKPEDVIRYEKEVTLSAAAIEANHVRRHDLDDALLINLLPFLANTEDSRVGFTHLDPATGELETLAGSRVYHLNIVTRHEVREPSARKGASFDRLRVVMDREGIRRIEKVAAP